jgi:hypothetical protein
MNCARATVKYRSGHEWLPKGAFARAREANWSKKRQLTMSKLAELSFKSYS